MAVLPALNYICALTAAVLPAIHFVSNLSLNVVKREIGYVFVCVYVIRRTKSNVRKGIKYMPCGCVCVYRL